MTTKPKAPRFRIRRSGPAPAAETSAPEAGSDGFGPAPFPGSAAAEAAPATGASLAAIRREGLTGRQLRMARRLAQKHNLEPASDFDAVRLLRERGIDPFARTNVTDLVAAKDERERARAAEVARQMRERGPTEPTPNVPQPYDESRNLPGAPAEPDAVRLHEIERIQNDIARRRRAKLAALGARLFVFVLLPTLAVAIYYGLFATPSYSTKSNFVVQQAEAQAVGGGLFGGTALATNQDSIMVQGFLGSREAMLRLDAEEGYRAHFSDPAIDALQRIPPDASNERLYDHYRDHVRIGFDPTEGVIRMEVTAMSPEASQRFSEALISYAEERVDQVTERKRSEQMDDARANFAEAEARMREAQAAVVELQQRLGVLDPASESSSLMGQIGTFETQLAEKRLQLQQLLDNRRPNEARVAGVQGDVTRLETLIGDLRNSLTAAAEDDDSLAAISAQLRMAEVDLETRTMMMQDALKQMETARIEANRQVRFLSTGMSPVPPDVPTAPNVLQNTLIAFLCFTGLYLLASLTVSILREQVSS